jgi:hypothetical protein
MNATRPQRMVRPTTRHGLRLAGHMTNKQADPEYDHMNKLAAMGQYEGWQRDCTKMLDLL